MNYKKSLLYTLFTSGNYYRYELTPQQKQQLHNVFNGLERYFELNPILPLIFIGNLPARPNRTNISKRQKDFSKEDCYEDQPVSDPFGCYYPILKIIVVDKVKILQFIKKNQMLCEASDFFEMVLFHELGHWISHQTNCKDLWLDKELEDWAGIVFDEFFRTNDAWEDSSFLSASIEIKEFWAQYLSFLIMNNNQKTLQKDFALNHQANPYQLYLLAEKKEPKYTLELLPKSRTLQWPELKEKLMAIKNVENSSF